MEENVDGHSVVSLPVEQVMPAIMVDARCESMCMVRVRGKKENP